MPVSVVFMPHFALPATEFCPAEIKRFDHSLGRRAHAVSPPAPLQSPPVLRYRSSPECRSQCSAQAKTGIALCCIAIGSLTTIAKVSWPTTAAADETYHVATHKGSLALLKAAKPRNISYICNHSRSWSASSSRASSHPPRLLRSRFAITPPTQLIRRDASRQCRLQLSHP